MYYALLFVFWYPTGRQSLTRLATHMAEFTCFQIELSKTYGPSEWREDVKGLMLRAGLYKRETVFLFSDTQVRKKLNYKIDMILH